MRSLSSSSARAAISELHSIARVGEGNPAVSNISLKCARKGVPELGRDFFDNDRYDDDAFDAELEKARGRIADTAERIRAGTLCSTPDSCAWNGGCSYPSICRVED